MKEEICCILVEWREGNGSKAMMIFDVDPNYPERYNYIVHYGIERHANPAGDTSLDQAAIRWNLCDMSALQILLEATQHLLGLLGMPRSDARLLYCGNCEQDCTIEE